MGGLGAADSVTVGDRMGLSRELFLLLRLLVAVASGLAPLAAEAVFFDLRGAQGLALDEVFSGSTTVGGITATLTAIAGELNQSGDGFGVNFLPGSGDDPDALDGDIFPESITITFNVNVFLNQIQLSKLSAGEEGAITIAGGTPISLVDTGVGDDEFNFNSANSVLTSESIVLSWVSGNGFSFDDFTVSPASALAGDFDGDGDRDGADFLLWQRDLADAPSLALWEANYGMPAPLAALLSVPEPTSPSLVFALLLGLAVGRRRKAR